MELTADIISGFSGSLLQRNFDGAVESPPCHYEWWQYCTSKYGRVAIAAPRKHAKSTSITLAYVLACVCFRDRQYAIIISDTIAQSVQFLADVKKELAENDKLRELFHIKTFLKDTDEDCIVECADGHQFRLQAKGSEQKMRGLKWNNKRPDLIVGDDLENDEIVMNKERRDKFRRWFYGAVVPCISQRGVIRVVGTILHEDSFLNNLMPNEWDKRTITTPLKQYREYQKSGEWLAVKYRAHSDDFKHILWATNYTQEWFEDRRQEFINQGIPDVYSQEYLNIPIDESIAFFKRGDFISLTPEDRKANLNYYITADLAISKEETADYSVFLVAGIDENRILHVKNVIRERLDAREIVDTILSLQKNYKPELFGIEEMQVSKAIGPFLREEMLKTGVFPNIMKLKHGGKDKITRARSIQGRLRAHTVKFEKSGDWYPTFEDELCKFPRGTRDDQVDALSYMGLMLDSLIEAPTNEEIEDDEYELELRDSGLWDAGRNSVTGY